jgi:probable HAF family extracellular repeat protein
MLDLGTLGGTYGLANWLNNAGEVVGQSNLAGDQTAHPFLWKDGKMTDLGTLGGPYGFANWISEHGDIAGAAQTAGQVFHAFLWRHGTMTDLQPTGGAPWAFASGVNDSGQVVGHDSDTQGQELAAVLWTGSHRYDLNTLIAPSRLHLVTAYYIDAHGDIVGRGALPNGDQRAFLLVRNRSVPLPSGPASARPLPATGPVDDSATAVLARHVARRDGLAAAIRQLRQEAAFQRHA